MNNLNVYALETWVMVKFLDRLIPISNFLAPVVQTVNSAIHRINHYPVNNTIGFDNAYPLDSDLSGG